MNRNLYIAEILESVDLIISDKANAAHKKNKFINKYKKFSNKNIYMSDNPETEKIIRDAEKSVKNKKKSTEEESLIDQNTRRAINLSREENLELARKRAERNKGNILGGESYLEEDTLVEDTLVEDTLEEENYSSHLASEKPLILDNTSDTLVLNNEFIFRYFTHPPEKATRESVSFFLNDPHSCLLATNLERIHHGVSAGY